MTRKTCLAPGCKERLMSQATNVALKTVSVKTLQSKIIFSFSSCFILFFSPYWADFPVGAILVHSFMLFHLGF